MKNYRQRQRAEKAAAALPTSEQIKIRDESGEQVEQLSRASGVPRNYPRSVWKKAAEALIEGDGQALEKVKALKSLCNVDKEWRRRVAEWVKTDQSEAVKKYIAAQGWQLTNDVSPKPPSLVDRMVAVLEAGQKLEDHFSKEELESPADPDPKHDELWANYQRYLQTGSMKEQPTTHGCNYCGKPATRQLQVNAKAAHFCDIHDGVRLAARPVSCL